MTTAWRSIWGLTAAAGAVLLVLGIIQSFNAADFCAGGSHYERFWLTSAIWFLAAPAGAWIVDRITPEDAGGSRRQLVYLGAVVCLAGLSIAAWQIDAINVPWFRDRDFPLGESWACAL